MNKKVQPTIISTEGVRTTSPKPTVIVAEPLVTKAENPPVYKPTTIPDKTNNVTTEHTLPKPKTFAPSSMPGNKRSRLPITMDNLKSSFPELDQNRLEPMLQMIWETDTQLMQESSALTWQNSLQKSYSEQVMMLLELTRHDALETAQTRLHRVLDILEAIDLHGVCEFNKDGIFTRFLKSANSEYDTPEELELAEKELNQLVSRLNKESEALVALQRQAIQLLKEIKVLESRVQCAANAASVLSTYFEKLGKSHSRMAAQFHERAVSLTKTKAQMIQNEGARELQINHLHQLMASIQDVVLVMLPDWLGSISTIRSMLDMKKAVTLTEVMELTDRKKKIISHLK